MRLGALPVMLAMTLFAISPASSAEECPPGQYKVYFEGKAYCQPYPGGSGDSGSATSKPKLKHEPERKKGFNRSQCLKDCRAGCAQKYPVAADLKRCSAGCSSGCAQ